MVKYDETKCYWCGADLIGKKGYYSLNTDTLKTRRSFCSPDHLRAFKDYLRKGGKPRPYLKEK